MRVCKLIGAALSISGSLLIGGSAIAEDAGHAEYMSACAVCHGQGGLGDGPLSYHLLVDVPDLTVLAGQNGGVFPMGEIIAIIDGRGGIRGHGDAGAESNEVMPVWGTRFYSQAVPEMGFDDAELMARGRILALAEHLESIQK